MIFYSTSQCYQYSCDGVKSLEACGVYYVLYSLLSIIRYIKLLLVRSSVWQFDEICDLSDFKIIFNNDQY